MTDLKRYDAVVNGTETILLLSAADAEALGDTVKPHGKSTASSAPAAKRASKPRNKAVTKTANKSTPASPPTPPPADGEQPPAE